MSRHFVNIKVGREERPDIDQIYQTAHQLLTRRPGGCPLTMFLTPEGKPFFGGTYFPKRSRFNLPGFDELLRQVAAAWDTQRDALMAQGDALVQHLAGTQPALHAGDGNAAGGDDTGDALALSAAQAATGLRDASMQAFDTVNCGFGGAPKFPQPPRLDALLRHALASGDAAARDAVLLTLRKMAAGGLCDHLGGGFARTCDIHTTAQVNLMGRITSGMPSRCNLRCRPSAVWLCSHSVSQWLPGRMRVFAKQMLSWNLALTSRTRVSSRSIGSVQYTTKRAVLSPSRAQKPSSWSIDRSIFSFS